MGLFGRFGGFWVCYLRFGFCFVTCGGLVLYNGVFVCVGVGLPIG